MARPAAPAGRAATPFSPIAQRFLDEAGLVEQFVALKHVFLEEAAPLRFEQQVQPRAARQAGGGNLARRLVDPALEARQDRRFDQFGASFAPILPGEEVVPGAIGVGAVGRLLAEPRQREIADRDDVRIAVAGAGVASAIPEGVELLDIADRRAGLLGDEGAQPDLEGAVAQGSNSPEGSAVGALAPGAA